MTLSTVADALAVLDDIACVLKPEGRDFAELGFSTSGPTGALLFLEWPRPRKVLHAAIDVAVGEERYADSVHTLVDRMPRLRNTAVRALVGGGASVYWNARLDPQSISTLAVCLGYGRAGARVARAFELLWGEASAVAYERSPSTSRLRFYNAIASHGELAQLGLVLESSLGVSWPRSVGMREVFDTLRPTREVMVNVALSRGTMHDRTRISCKLEFPRVKLSALPQSVRKFDHSRQSETAVNELLAATGTETLCYLGLRWSTETEKLDLTYYIDVSDRIRRP